MKYFFLTVSIALGVAACSGAKPQKSDLESISEGELSDSLTDALGGDEEEENDLLEETDLWGDEDVSDERPGDDLDEEWEEEKDEETVSPDEAIEFPENEETMEEGIDADEGGEEKEETPDMDNPPVICTPYETIECPYPADPNTKGVGPCKAATKTCLPDGTGWSNCVGEVLPTVEICGNGIDDNCNGDTDENIDEDGDGWGVCSGDCCDSIFQCADPEKVNPGAIEVKGDGVDNDCNGTIDEDPRIPCSSGAKFSGTTALDLVNALDLCKVSEGGSWGIVGTPTLTRADETSAVHNLQIAVMEQFGTHPSNVAIYGGTMAALSSGRARDADDPNPTTNITYTYAWGNPPADFSAPYGGGANLPQTNPSCPVGSGANDSVMLTVQLKVPTNALSFSFNFRFFSQEYWDYQCSEYNDFFIAMLYTGATGIPADRNISFDSKGNYISVNSDQFFTVCQSKSGGCGGGGYNCPDGTAALEGTGWNPPDAGGTQWLSTSAPVIPGETITLKFVIWDTSDQALDSIVLLDNFKWSAEGTSGPSTFQCWDLNKNGVCDIATEDLSGDGACSERDC